MSATVLYTPEVLGLATSLASWRWDDALPLRGEGRSKNCGSTILVGLALDDQGRIERIGLRSQACAVGQAAAAIFARGAGGRDAAAIAHATEELAAWLKEGGPLPDWPGLSAIAAAREYPARHGAIMLAWNAARDALSSR